MLTRRRFLQGLGASVLGASLLPGLPPSVSWAQGAARARRLLVFFSPNGTIHRFWRPTGSGSDFSFGAGTILEPLERHKSDLLVIDGLNFFTGTNHEGGMAAMLTNGGGAGTATGGMSIDQYVASRLGASDRFSSLEFGILTDIWGSNVQTRMSYSAAGQLVHPDANPRRAFDRMFSDLAGDAVQQSRLRSRRASVLDLVRGELNDLKGRVGAREKIKLDAHLTAIRSVEQSLQTEISCDVPTAPEQLNKDANDNVPAITKAQIDLAVTALACNMTKVSSVQVSHTVSPVVFSWVGNTEGHHSLSHTSDNNQTKLNEFVDAERWCAEQFAYLLDRMKQTPDPDSDGSLLDSTVVLWAKEMGDSRAHVCQSVPFVMAGGGFRAGRYLRFEGDSHSKLLVSICHALGLDNQTFGDPTTATGGLDGLV